MCSCWARTSSIRVRKRRPAPPRVRSRDWTASMTSRPGTCSSTGITASAVLPVCTIWCREDRAMTSFWWNTPGRTGSMCRWTAWGSSSASKVARVRNRPLTVWAAPAGVPARRRSARPSKRSRPTWWRCTPTARWPRAFATTRRASCTTNSRRPSALRRPRIRPGPSRTFWPTWTSPSPWTVWSVVTWASARPKWPCGQPSARPARGVRWPCCAPPRCWPSSITRPSGPVWPVSRSRWAC